MLRRDLTGQQFGNLTVLRFHSSSRNGHARWLCKCSCGTEKDVLGTHLVQGGTKSCGCKRPRKSERKQWTGYGGISGQWWSRVTRQRTRASGRVPIEVSVTIQEAWHLFLAQKRHCALSGRDLVIGDRHGDAGNASLDRIDSSKGYVLDNVQWVHKDVNKMKNAFDESYFVRMCVDVAAHKKRTPSQCDV